MQPTSGPASLLRLHCLLLGWCWACLASSPFTAFSLAGAARVAFILRRLHRLCCFHRLPVFVLIAVEIMALEHDLGKDLAVVLVLALDVALALAVALVLALAIAPCPFPCRSPWPLPLRPLP